MTPNQIQHKVPPNLYLRHNIPQKFLSALNVNFLLFLPATSLIFHHHPWDANLFSTKATKFVAFLLTQHAKFPAISTAYKYCFPPLSSRCESIFQLRSPSFPPFFQCSMPNFPMQGNYTSLFPLFLCYELFPKYQT